MLKLVPQFAAGPDAIYQRCQRNFGLGKHAAAVVTAPAQRLPAVPGGVVSWSSVPAAAPFAAGFQVSPASLAIACTVGRFAPATARKQFSMTLQRLVSRLGGQARS